MTTAPVNGTRPVAGSGGTVAPTAGDAPSLLPPPAPAAPGDIGDAVTQLMQLSSELSQQQTEMGRTDADIAASRREAAANKRKEAINKALDAARKAREAANDKGFFASITDNIGLTGLVGLVTFNPALVAADYAAHRAGLTNGGTNMFDLGTALAGSPLLFLAEQSMKKIAPEAMSSGAFAATMAGGPIGYALEQAVSKLTPDNLAKSLAEVSTIKDDDVRVANKWAFMAAMTAAAATTTVLSGGTGAPAIVALIGMGISTTTQLAAETGLLQAVVGDKAAIWVAAGGAIVGAALSLGASVANIASSASGLASTAEGAAKISGEAGATLQGFQAGAAIVEGAADIESGIRGLEVAGYQKEAEHANADAVGARNVLKRIEVIIDGILDDLNEVRDSSKRATETLNQTLQINSQTLLQAGSMKV